MDVGNDVGLSNMITNEEKKTRHQGIYIRDQLRILLKNHDMHRTRNEE